MKTIEEKKLREDSIVVVEEVRVPVKVLVEGSHRARMDSLESDTKFSKVRVSLIAEPAIDNKDEENLARFIKAKFHDFIKITKKLVDLE